MTAPAPLSILDLAPVPSGGTPADALRNSLDLARHAERLGYRRYWLAEHHLAAGVASSAPAVLIGLVAAATTRIRVGSGAVQLGYHTGYWSAGPPAGVPEAIAQCERLGFDSIWAAEAYGSDCLTPLAWWGASTERIRLGTNIMQISARTPAARNEAWSLPPPRRPLTSRIANGIDGSRPMTGAKAASKSLRIAFVAPIPER